MNIFYLVFIMSCERPIRIPNPRYSCCIGAENFNPSKAYDGVTIQDYCESLFGYRGRPPDEFIDVPCGKCFSCNRTRLNGWRLRLMSEVNRYPNSVFVTLTFNDKYLAKFREDPNRAVRLFLDRTRKKYGMNIRHFFIPEYGTLKGRVHYHGILFNYPLTKLDPVVFAKEWKYGFIYLGWCNEKTCNYIVKYITKDAPKGVKPPRIIASKGLGESYVTEHGAYHHQKMKPYISIKGKYRVPLPRYYLTKIFTDYERILLQEQVRLEPFVRFVDGIEYHDELTYKYALKRYAEKQISIGLSPRPTTLPDTLRQFVYPRAEYIPVTPWDTDNNNNNSFNNLWTGNYKYLVPMGVNAYYWSETPF